MTSAPEALAEAIRSTLGESIAAATVAFGEVTAVVPHDRLLETMRSLRDAGAFRFDQLIDVCGVDYSTYANAPRVGPRFAAVYHLLSMPNNARLRVRSFALDDDFPVLPSMIDLWPSANWFEREAFDLYGIMFTGHPDLRRLLTDYGFVGHPFRKDFPVFGHVEMRFDPEQGRVIYQPVTIEAREITPRIVRERNYADNE
ncbi:MAG: NADH-quinone oxidoreductase subunit C [Betaproteobacteria bacterium]